MREMTKAKEISLCAMMIAVALALSFAERFIPLQWILPLPGFKLGLANVVTLVALCLFKKKYVLAILVIRCLLGSAFGGGVTALAFSVCGGLLALGTMLIAAKTNCFSIYGISALGAAAHNVGQILAAMALMKSVYIGAYLPYLLLVGVATGLMTGAVCAGILRVLPKAVYVNPEESIP